MSADASTPRPEAEALPFSSMQGPVAELIAQGMLSPPSRPGALAALDRFEILRELGRGGMGVVLLGRDPGAAQEVAIKLVRSDLAGDARALQRFVKEAGHLKRLRHPSVVPVLEISDRPRGPYFVMPYFETGSLASRLRPGEPMEREAILEAAQAVAEGLDFAHRRGIIHRDLKPANLLLKTEGGICLADFGLARSLFNDTLVDLESRQHEGTAAYMSPATAAGDAEDTRCDIYAFGALLYEMLTGQPPYQGQTTKEIIEKIRAGPPKPILSLNPRADRGLADIADGAMARELRDRYAEMQDVLDDLQRVRQRRPPRGPHGATRAGLLLWGPVALALAAVAGWLLWHGAGSARVPPTPSPPSAQAKTEKPPPARPPAVVPRIRIVPQTAPVFQTPWGIAADLDGNILVSDKDEGVIWKLTTTGFTNLAGIPGDLRGADGLDAPGRLALPRGIATDPAGKVYFADAHRLRTLAPGGSVTPFPERANGPGEERSFDLPSGMAADTNGNVYVAERYTILKITPKGEVSVLAGTEGVAGHRDGLGTNAQFSDMEKGLALDSADNLYVGDRFNHLIRKVTPEGEVTTLAGCGVAGTNDGPLTKACFNKPCGVAVNKAGVVYVADGGNHTIRKITPGPDGRVSTLAGIAGRAGLADGPVTNALFHAPEGVDVDAAGNVWVVDTGNRRLRRITPDGRVVTVAPSSAAPVPSEAAPDSKLPPPITLPPTAHSCVRFARAGVGEGVILAFVRGQIARQGPKEPPLTDEQILYLEDQGVSEKVISALIEEFATKK